jgi:hypothetical protein
MDKILGGLVLINGTDIWKEYGVFLTEEKKGGRENLNAILTPSKAKEHVAWTYGSMTARNTPGAGTRQRGARHHLHFAQYARSREQWLANYMAFIRFLKTGRDGWLTITFTELGLTLKVFYLDCSAYRSLTYLWKEGVQASRYKVRFREPEPII